MGGVMPSSAYFLLPSDNNDDSYESLGIMMPSNTDISLTSDLPLDALGPVVAAEGTYSSNDASCESLGVVMPSNADFRCLPTTMILHMKVWAHFVA